MQGARFILNSRFFHIAKPGEELSEYALSKGHVEQLVEYCATRETVDYNLIINSSDELPATHRQKETVKELIDALESNSRSLNFYELDDYKAEGTRKNALKLISRITEEILSDDSFNENALQAAQNAKKTMDFYDRNKRQATGKQIDTINQLLKEINYKENEDMPLEYDDYISAPTMQNASELISRLSEELLIKGGFDEISNLVEYAAKRPGAVKVGEHGLFSSKENVDLEAAKEEVSNHEGNIWTHILSLRREDAAALDYESQRPWRNLIMANIDTIAEVHNIKPENLRWYAAMHNTAHHPHIHLFVYSADPKEGCFNEKRYKSITNLKRKLVTQIFNDERYNIYIGKDLYRDELKAQAEEILDKLLKNPNKYISDKNLNDLTNKMLTLSQKYTGGQTSEPKYGYQTKEVKALVDDIQHSLVSQNEQLSKLYSLWAKEKYSLNKFYVKNKLPDIQPIEKAEDFNKIKRTILKEAKNIREGKINIVTEQSYDFSQNAGHEHTDISTRIPQTGYTIDELLDTEEYAPNIKNNDAKDEAPLTAVPKEKTYKTTGNTSKYNLVEKYMKEYPEKVFYSTEPDDPELMKELGSNFIFKSDDENVKKFKSLSILANDFSSRTGEICRNLADCYNYGNGTKRDIESAVMWYGIAADQFQDSMASYRLGQIYKYGADEIDIEEENGNLYFKQAYDLFINEIKNGEYFVELETGADELHYQENAAKSEAYKEYLIGRMYLKGDGIDQNYFNAYQSFLLAAENGYTHANYYIGNQYFYGLGVDKNINKAIRCFEKSTLNGNASAAYKLAVLFDEGTEVPQDSEKSFLYYQISAELDNPYAHYKLGNLALEKNDILTAINHFERAAEKNISHAWYKLGQIYSNEEQGMLDTEKANLCFSKALKQYIADYNESPDDFTAYRIGHMYLNSIGTEQNISEAAAWFEKSAQQGNPDAAYQLGIIYSQSDNEFFNSEKANEYFSFALDSYISSESEEPNGTIEYRLGKMFFNGLGTEKDIFQAIKWFEKALANKNTAAAYQLGKIYYDGENLPKDLNKAEEYFKISSESDNPYAHYCLGNINLEKNDILTAINHFEQAAEKNISHAWYKLGQIYSNGEQGMLDTEKANLCFSKALKQYIADYNESPDDFTAYRIGHMYLNSIGTEQNISEAAAWLEKSAQQGNPDAAYQLGIIYSQSDTEFYNLEKANNSFSFALNSYLISEKKEPNSSLEYRLGKMFLNGFGTEKNISQAIKWFEKALANKNTAAAYQLGKIYYSGIDIPTHLSRAEAYFNISAKSDNSYAYYYLGNISLEKNDIPQAIKHFEKAADKNISHAWYKLGQIYSNEEQGMLDTEKANLCFSKALKQYIADYNESPDDFTAYRIGHMYLNSIGTEQNISESAAWLEKSAQQGNPDAAYQLGILYSSNKYVIQDINKSNKYYSSAIAGYEKSKTINSNASAEYHLGKMYQNGFGTHKNTTLAIRWYLKSIENGNINAAYQLGKIYYDGEDLPKDLNKAEEYFKISSADNPYAHYYLGNINLEKNDILTAINHFEQAAEKNISHAWYKLGQIYSNEERGMLDTEKANLCFSKALKQYIADYNESPDDFTAYRIGHMYLNSIGTEQNISEAAAWFEKSAQQGNPDAAYQLGYIYKIDKYGIKNDDLSNKYFSFALSSYQQEFSKHPTDGDLAMRIGTFYHYGLGTEQDIKKAIEWYKKAVELGNQKAQQKIDEAEQMRQLSVMSVATTACHFGRMLNTETIAAAKNRYISDTKILHREKVQKIYAGQAVDDNAQSYDY